ncbi:MAG: hypothetical protein AVDCRST_MAG56-2152 [uncultured Cytophagales bacterium]|uniref:Vitellogenin II n=1 Tax=uncultured Cytophagales bacterium TaxID=158755 RepID=A0A6J4IL25_9SPHI|nr:MAG: hypothetical protein AVDCRST_MAG56-2152 [uncultured Cytophagales bacterium]
MKALTKYAALALVAGLWSCTSTKVAQQTQGEYDDLYFTSKDREQALTASASSSSVQYDQMDRVEDASAQQNANPDYVATDNRRQKDRNADAYNASDTYYDESYADRRRFGSIRPSVAAGGVYSSPAYYDPFFSPYGYDSFHARNAYSSFYYDPFFSNRPYWGFRPGVSISISYNTWGRPWGWNAWGADPYWNAGPWGYNAWNSWGYDPFWGGGFAYGPVYNNWYGGGWNRPWYGGGNTYIINNNGDNTATRNFGPRGSRSADRVNDRLDNSPRDRNNNGGRLSQEGDDTQVTRPTRARSPRSVEGDPYGTTPGTPREGYRSGRTDVNTNPDVITTRPTAPAGDSRSREVYSAPRPTRPQGSDYSTGGNQRSSDYYNSNRNSGAPSQPSQPTYSAPRSNGGSYEYSRPSRSNSDGGYNSGSSGGYNSGRSSGSSYSGGSAPASSPSPSSSGGSSGGSRARGRN